MYNDSSRTVTISIQKKKNKKKYVKQTNRRGNFHCFRLINKDNINDEYIPSDIIVLPSTYRYIYRKR